MNSTLTPLDLKPNPKAMRTLPPPPAATEKGVLKVTADIKDSLVLKVETAPVLRRCSMCSVMKPLTEYHTNRARKDLLDARCRSCTKLYKIELKKRKDAGEVIRRRGKVVRVQTAVVTASETAVPEPRTNETALQQRAILARGAAIQQAVATAEIVAAVSLLLGMDRVQSDTIIRMVQAFYNVTEE